MILYKMDLLDFAMVLMLINIIEYIQFKFETIYYY